MLVTGSAPLNTSRDWPPDHASDIALFDATAEVFQPGGRTVSAGDLIVRADYAASLETIANERSAAIYGGPLGQIVADNMAANGGLITIDDLSAYSTIHTDPVTGSYRGHQVSGPPPGNSGITLIIELLNILEGFDVASMGFGTVEGAHLLIETLKIAFADRFAYLGDPATVDIPLEWLTSKEYAVSRRGDIDMAAATPAAAGQRGTESSYTTHLTTADDEGNIVSMTQTINELFGSKVTVPGTGLMLNNTQAMFDPHPGQPNSVAPNKRVVSSMGAGDCQQGRSTLARNRHSRRRKDLPNGASGNREHHRSPHDPSGGSRGPSSLDARPDRRGRSHVWGRCQMRARSKRS